MENKTQVFFVVDSLESNEEIFETLEEAQAHFLSVLGTEENKRIYIAKVRNAYKENGVWNYEDRSDTFEIIKVLEGEENTDDAQHPYRQIAIHIIEEVIEGILERGVDGEEYYRLEDEIVSLIEKGLCKKEHN